MCAREIVSTRRGLSAREVDAMRATANSTRRASFAGVERQLMNEGRTDQVLARAVDGRSENAGATERARPRSLDVS